MAIDVTQAETLQLSPEERSRLEQVEGLVFDVQRYSLHDGPGLRTNVFLKGCPLHCPWCANPESQRGQPELALFAQHCITCGQFEPACPVAWGEGNGRDEAILPQEDFDRRAAACPTCAIRWIGQRRTAGDVMREVLRDAPFYGPTGGMTVTGGEPTVQPAMAEALLRLGRDGGISTALQTCGYAPWKVLARLTPFLDLVLYDLKLMDSPRHLAMTGMGNELILDNLRRLAARDVPVRVRVPLIPGFNATHEDMGAIARFVAALNGAVQGVDLLPYHKMARSKYKALGREYLWAGYDRLDDAQVKDMAAVLESAGLAVTVGGG